jgi:hypothetical protein
MNAKELFERDIAVSFFNPGEFATVHRVNGKNMECVLEEPNVGEYSRQATVSRTGMEIMKRGNRFYANRVVFFVPARQFGNLPAKGSSLVFDEKRYSVVEAADNSGVFEIQMEKVTQ